MPRTFLALALSSSLLLTPAGRSALLGGLQALLSPGAGGPVSKAGCGFDPNGRCTPAPIDAGCGADPNGCPCGS